MVTCAPWPTVSTLGYFQVPSSLQISARASWETDGAIQRVFLTDRYNPRGRYVVQLYCGQLQRLVPVAVDDMIPVTRGTTSPIFVKPNGKELWVLWVALLEKPSQSSLAATVLSTVDTHFGYCRRSLEMRFPCGG